MIDPENDDTENNWPTDPEDQLTELTQVATSMGRLITRAYAFPGKTEEQKKDLDESQETLEEFVRRVDEARSQVLAKLTELTQDDIDDVIKAKIVLDKTVRQINDINEVIHIITQVAAIAAGMMV